MSVAAADAIAVVLLLAVTAYSVGGGTDYGAGIWDLLAGGRARGEKPRALIDHAMGPVWEANNVWLVFAAVLCWTGFPILWQSVFASLYPLFLVALLGLILRGAFFAFRKPATTPALRTIANAVFGASSVLAPFGFAAILGAIASGRVGVGVPAAPVWEACVNPTSISFGLFSVSATALSGASFLVGDARRYGAGDMVDYFRVRAILAGLATMLMGAIAMAALALDSPATFRGMVGGLGLPFTVVAVVVTPVVLFLLWRRVYVWHRVLTVIAVASFVLAWGFGQAPYLLPGRLTVAQAAGAPATQVFLLVVTVVAVILVVPSLALLYRLDQRNDLEPPQAGTP